ncbi:MAG: QacE family quaternary ammonium compound efflux SMR transporter, partial [Rhodospirillaceae bacterium]|nr:QacE family quaternary ammonium compound efflux SMR transporter [Rhodospirillaceae bacterium]
VPISIVYATWSGLGVFTVSILGYFLFGQGLSWQIIFGLFLIVIGVIIVNISSSVQN